MSKLIQIGNSQGIRIPKVLVKQAGLEGIDLELEVLPQGLLIKPFKKARANWQEAINTAISKQEVDYDHEWLDADLDSEDNNT